MKAMAILEFGTGEVFKLIDMEKPVIKPGHVLIKAQASSINPLDCKLRNGTYANFVPKFPMVLHGDVAGTVVEVGENVTQFKIGDEVYGCAGGLNAMQGALAEFMLADANLLALKPKSLSFREAAALPLVSLTAWEGLITKAKLQKNQTVLVHGGTGGVGHLAIQLAKHLGGQVFATGSDERKLAIAKELGAHAAINYKQAKPAEYVQEHTAGKGFDVVFETVGGDNLLLSIEAAKAYGQVISILSSKGLDLSPAFVKNLSLHFVFQPLPLVANINRAHYGDILVRIAKLVDEGVIKPLIDEREFSISEVGLAHEYLENGHAIGKVVVDGF